MTAGNRRSTVQCQPPRRTIGTTMSAKVIFVLFIVILKQTTADNPNLGYKVFKKIYNECDQSNDILKCFKIQALKVADRALHTTSFKIIDGVHIIRDKAARSFPSTSINYQNLEALEHDQIDQLLTETTEKFLDSHKIKLDPKLIEEARGKGNRIMRPLLAAMAIKGGMMAMAMKGVAMMAGAALMMGKMALMISSIIGLKKLLSGKSEKTTVEIVKHPQISYGSSYSQSYEDGGHYGGGHSGGGGGGGYHRSLETSQISPQERVYAAHVPNKIR